MIPPDLLITSVSILIIGCTAFPEKDWIDTKLKYEEFLNSLTLVDLCVPLVALQVIAAVHVSLLARLEFHKTHFCVFAAWG